MPELRAMAVPAWIGHALVASAHVRVLEGDLGRAHAEAEEALTIFRQGRDRNRIAAALAALAHAAQSGGRPADAARSYQESLRSLGPDGGRELVVRSLEGLAASVTALGHPEPAAAWLASAAAFRAAASMPVRPVEQPELADTLAAARAALGEERFQSIWAAGQATSLEDTLTAALAYRL